MRTILVIYLSDFLQFSETNATVFYHLFVSLCYYTPVIGAIIADSFLGKFKTIFYISIIYAIGQVVLTIGATDMGYNGSIALSFVGLGLIAFGTGGIKVKLCLRSIYMQIFISYSNSHVLWASVQNSSNFLSKNLPWHHISVGFMLVSMLVALFQPSWPHCWEILIVVRVKELTLVFH